jgi:hypothetical protein
MTDFMVNTDELRRVVSEEVHKAVIDLPSIADVDAKVDAKLSVALAHYPRREELEAVVDKRVNALLQPVVSEIQAGFTKMDRALAVLIEQTRHNEETVREVKATQQHHDVEMDTLKQIDSARGERLTALEDKVTGVIFDVFGAPDRQGTRSLFDHITDLGKELSAAIGTSAREFTQGIAILQTNIGILTTRIEAVEVTEHTNQRWIEARQKVERLVIQSLPKASKRLGEALTDHWVQKWAMRIGLAGGLSVLAALLERFSA